MVAGRKSNSRGFSLIEVMIVLVVLGILASMVIPQFAAAENQAAQVVFARSVARFNEAAQIYYTATGNYLEDSSSGVMPTGWEPYVDELSWTKATPIGGVWDFELNSYGITSGFGVHFLDADENPGDAYMLEIDLLIDDGDLATGSFRKIDSDRYYNVLFE